MLLVDVCCWLLFVGVRRCVLLFVVVCYRSLSFVWFLFVVCCLSLSLASLLSFVVVCLCLLLLVVVICCFCFRLLLFGLGRCRLWLSVVCCCFLLFSFVVAYCFFCFAFRCRLSFFNVCHWSSSLFVVVRVGRCCSLLL